MRKRIRLENLFLIAQNFCCFFQQQKLPKNILQLTPSFVKGRPFFVCSLGRTHTLLYAQQDENINLITQPFQHADTLMDRVRGLYRKTFMYLHRIRDTWMCLEGEATLQCEVWSDGLIIFNLWSFTTIRYNLLTIVIICQNWFKILPVT